MAVRDLEAFVRQRAALFDPSLDVTPGSPFDVQVIQPLTRRLGQDPFSVDLSTFIHDRIAQAFPELANKEGDAVTDLLNKPITLLWDPIVREIFRIRRGLSFQDPSSLTVEEAEALGANLFADRNVGDFARGIGRVFFSQAQNLSISPANFSTTKTGLHFFPTEIQSIRLEEMLLNVSPDGLFYFDINLIAEAAGDQYNIEPNSLASIANIPSAVRVTNTRRFGFGVSDETAVEFVDRAKQELTERSLVTLRGIAAKLIKAFPEVRRLNVVGFNDPEMQRDIIKGGGAGPVVAFGTNGLTNPDGENKNLTRRFSAPIGGVITSINGVLTVSDFIALIGPPGIVPPGFVFTPSPGISGGEVRDIRVRAVVDPLTIDLEEQVLVPAGLVNTWTLRRVELTLSDIPGGIVFPDGPQGTITVPDDQIHIGGATDIHVKGQDFDEATLAIDNVTDDRPALSGLQLQIPGFVASPPYIDLLDLITDFNYATGDATFRLLEDARFHEFSVQIVNGPSAGSYRIVDVLQLSGSPVRLFIDPPTPTLGGAPFRWRIFDLLNIDLTEPKETRISDDDLKTIQNSAIVTTAGGIDFQELGVAKDDVLRIFDGPDAGDYTLVEDPLTPSFDHLRLNRVLTSTHSSLRYTIFRANSAGGVIRPVIRVESIDLLDTSKQPLGSKIPYAKPIDIQSRAFQNPGRGTKVEVRDAVLGIVSLPATFGLFTVTGLTLNFTFPLDLSISPFTVTFSGVLTVAQVVNEINAASSVGTIATVITGDRVGILPTAIGSLVPELVVINSGTALPVLFGSTTTRTTADIHSEEIESTIGWIGVSPAINQDNLDVAMVLDGNQIGFYGDLRIILPTPSPMITPPITGLLSAKFASSGIIERAAQFFPEIGRHLIVGSRSIGSVRCFFLEPTSIEFDEQSFFSVTLIDGGTVRFFPDPTVDYQKIPALPGGAHPMDGLSTSGSSTFDSASQDFFKSGIKVGDHLTVNFHPIEGTLVLPDPVPGLANLTFVFAIVEGPDRTLTYIRDDLSIPVTDVTRQGVIDQINAAVGKNVAVLTGANTVKFNTDVLFIVRGSGSANPVILGNVANTAPVQSFGSDQDNISPHSGNYTITGLSSPTSLSVTPFFPSAFPFFSPVTDQSFEVHRPSLQRISTTQMAENAAEASLFFFDVELVSEGTGDLWNIPSSLQLTAEGFRSDGYFLSTSNPNLTFSTAELVELAISRSILEQGVDDDPSNATQVSSQNIQVNYQRANLVGDVQNFISSETERVVNESPLSRNLIPHFVRFDLEYTGGSREEIVKPDLENYIKNLFPIDAVQVSAIENIISGRGATSIKNPVDLIAVVYNTDRTVQAQRSQDKLTTGRLSAFIPDVLNITRTT